MDVFRTAAFVGRGVDICIHIMKACSGSFTKSCLDNQSLYWTGHNKRLQNNVCQSIARTSWVISTACVQHNKRWELLPSLLHLPLPPKVMALPEECLVLET